MRYAIKHKLAIYLAYAGDGGASARRSVACHMLFSCHLCSARNQELQQKHIKGPVTGTKYWNSISNGSDPDWGYWKEVRQAYVLSKLFVLPKEHREAILS